ncbi:hypothetical protein P3L10_031202 [Capsicum annuum]
MGLLCQGSLDHIMLPASMRSVDNLVRRLRNALAAKTIELEVAQATLDTVQAAHEDEKKVLQAKIASLTTSLERERSENADIARKIL